MASHSAKCPTEAVVNTPDAEGCLEVVVGDSHGVQDLCIDGLILQVDDIHLLADALQSRLCAQGCQVSAHISVCVLQPCCSTLEQLACVDTTSGLPRHVCSVSCILSWYMAQAFSSLGTSACLCRESLHVISRKAGNTSANVMGGQPPWQWPLGPHSRPASCSWCGCALLPAGQSRLARQCQSHGQSDRIAGGLGQCCRQRQ